LRNEDDMKQQNTWVERLLSWGYVVLQADSFGPRGYDNICERNVINDRMRSLDAYCEKSFLSTLITEGSTLSRIEQQGAEHYEQ
jgi:hypothetical protein